MHLEVLVRMTTLTSSGSEEGVEGSRPKTVLGDY